MHKTRTPLSLWFWAAYLVTTHTPGISAVQLQRQLGISRYETAWLILHKLRRAMVAPERTPLSDEVEADETLVGGRHSERRGGRQRDGKALVGVAVEVRGAGSGRLRLQVLADASQDTLTPWVKASVKRGAIVHTDGWNGYGKLAGSGYEHRPRLQRRRHPDEQKLLPRAHRTSSNLKTWLQGTTAASHPSTCRSTSTSSSFATTAAAHPWPPSRRCSASEPSTSPPPTTRSPTQPASLPRSRPDSHERRLRT